MLPRSQRLKIVQKLHYRLNVSAGVTYPGTLKVYFRTNQF